MPRCPMFFAKPRAMCAQYVFIHRANVAEALLADVTLNAECPLLPCVPRANVTAARHNP